MLATFGIKVIACDKKERSALGDLANEFEKMGVFLHLGPNYLQNINADVIFRTPGMRPDLPELLAAKQKGSIITSEMEAFFTVCPCPIIAVTGSDGKTTTTTIIAEFLKSAGRRVFLGGNIGHPLLAEAEEIHEDDLVVLELSSFQLMEMPYSPHIAVLTNLAPNHLDVHRDMEEYVASKENIFLHQTNTDIAIFNADNKITRELSRKALGEIRLFSRQAEVANGVFLQDGAIFFRTDNQTRKILNIDEIKIPGLHNVENYMAAIAAVEGLVEDDVIRAVARQFNGVEHRIELVRKVNGVSYYNDSIATSPSRAIAGLRSFSQKVIMIAGGYDKHIPFSPLAPEIVSHVKLLILCGATADMIRAAVEACQEYKNAAHKPEIIMAATLQQAVDTAYTNALPGDIVTLCPACAAFDQFSNFMERGKTYKQMIASLEK